MFDRDFRGDGMGMTIRTGDRAVIEAQAVNVIGRFDRRRARFAPQPSLQDGQWYIVHGDPRMVAKRLRQLDDMGEPLPVELFVPMERVTTGSGARKRSLDLPLFGSYFFARMDLDHGVDVVDGRCDRSRESAAGRRLESFKLIDGVAGFLGVDAAGWPRPFAQMIFFQQLLASPIVERKVNPIKVGTAIKMLTGPFIGFDGIVSSVLGRLDKNQRVAILVSIFGRPVRVEVPTRHIEVTQSG
jgi:transcription antitermination factor NusG